MNSYNDCELLPPLLWIGYGNIYIIKRMCLPFNSGSLKDFFRKERIDVNVCMFVCMQIFIVSGGKH